MHKLFISFLLLFELCGCSNIERDFPNGVFDDSLTINPTKIVDLAKYNVLDAGYCEQYKGWLFFRDEKITRNCVKAVSIDFDKTAENLNVGNGPCDVSNYTKFYVNNDSLFLYDANLRKILHIDIVNDSIKANPYHQYNGRTGRLIPIARQRFLSIDLYDSAFFKIINLDDNPSFRHPYPNDKELENMEYLSQNTIYSNTWFAISPSKDKIAFGVSETGMYGFGRIVNQDSIRFDTIIQYYPIKIGKIVNKCVIPDRCNISNVVSAASSEKYVFFLHKGTEYQEYYQSIFSHRILIYTWQGKPYKIINFKENPNLTDLHFDTMRNVLYGVGHNPECQYVEIDLKGIVD